MSELKKYICNSGRIVPIIMYVLLARYSYNFLPCMVLWAPCSKLKNFLLYVYIVQIGWSFTTSLNHKVVIFQADSTSHCDGHPNCNLRKLDYACKETFFSNQTLHDMYLCVCSAKALVFNESNSKVNFSGIVGLLSAWY